MNQFERIADLDELAEGELLAAECGDLPIVLLRLESRIFALHDRCPHRGGPLSEGTVEGEHIRCPWHGALIDPVSGYASPPAQNHARCLAVRLSDDDGIEVAP